MASTKLSRREKAKRRRELKAAEAEARRIARSGNAEIEGLAKSDGPSFRILQLRQVYSFVQPPPKERLDGRNGEIDSEICDDIGKLCALGLLDNHGHDPIEMRDKGRFWGGHCAKIHKALGVKMGSYERASKGMPSDAVTPDDLRFERMDESLWDSRVVDSQICRTKTFERKVLWSLLVDPLIGYTETMPWTQGLIQRGLLERKRLPENELMVFPTLHDKALLDAAIRGLVILVDGSLSARWAERSAA